jgi:hypothetical protein
VLTYTTNVVFRCTGLEELHTLKPAYRFIFIGPDGTFATIVAIDGCDHWRFSLVGSRAYRKLTAADLRAAIERAVGCRFDFDILSILPWTRRELIANRYGTNRIFLVGDSAHQLSPTGGFGINTGIKSNRSRLEAGSAVVGLGRLHPACVLREGAAAGGGAMSRRRPVISLACCQRARTVPRRKISQSGPAGDAARRVFGAKFTAIMRREWFTLGIQLGYGYENSPICVPDGTPAPPEQTANYLQTARPGHRAPHL